MRQPRTDRCLSSLQRPLLHPESLFHFMISDQLLAKFDAIVRNYPVKRSALIPILLTTQEHLGHLSDESIAAIARYLELPEIEVYEVVTFYSMLRQAASRKASHSGLHKHLVPAAWR